MNVVFDALAALAGAAALSSRKQFAGSTGLFVATDVPFLAAGLGLGVLSHGCLDVAPHAYPINSVVDVLLGALIFVSALFFVRRRSLLLLAACSLGSIFPDLFDLGPAIMNRRLGWSLPVMKFLPWHWRQYSGSVYDGSRAVQSFISHLIVFAVSLGILCAFRKSLFRLTQDGMQQESPPASEA